MIKNESIRQLIDLAQIEEVVSDYVTLKKRGVNYIGNCPFHDEKTPSFTVSPTKGIYKCFGCGESGNSIGFVMAQEQLSFVEAVRVLAQKFNFQLEETEQTKEELALKDEREALFIVTKFANEYFQNNLWQTSIGKSIGLSYFKERGFTEQTIKAFELGYATDGFQNFIDFAKRKKYTPELLEKAGLIKEKNDKHFDFFRDRVMFPIHNTSGKVIAFGGRTLQTTNKKIPKYINSSETDIYNKSKVLYGLHLAKKSIAKEDNCFLVEGYTDVISLHQAGVENVVASSGTSLTSQQVRLVKRYTKTITLLFDGDQAGLKAALRGVDLILPEDINVRILPLPPAHDPDSFIREMGYQRFQTFAKENSQDFILFKLKFLLGDSKKDPVARTEATKSIIESIALIDDSIKRSFYIRECAEVLEIEEQILHIETNKIKRNKHKKQVQQEEAFEQKQLPTAPKQGDFQQLVNDKISYAEREILRVLIEYSDLPWELEEYDLVIDYILSELYGQDFSNENYQKVLTYIRQSYEQGEHFSMSELPKIQDQEVLQICISIINKPYELSHNWREKHEIFIDTEREKVYEQDVQTSILTYKLVMIGQMLRIKEEQLKQSDDEEQQILLLTEIQALKKILFNASSEQFTVLNKEIEETHWRQIRNFYLH